MRRSGSPLGSERGKGEEGDERDEGNERGGENVSKMERMRE